MRLSESTTYELLLADIVELIPTSEQKKDLKNLLNQESDKYRFATAEQITCFGMDIEGGKLYEWIGDHTKKILPTLRLQSDKPFACNL